MTVRTAVLMSVSLALAACGGGGASSPDADQLDAAIDAPDVDAEPDAGIDAMIDAPDVDAEPDAMIDAMPDAMIDAMVDAMPDMEPDAPDATPDAGEVCDIVPFTTGVSTLVGCQASGAGDGAREVARLANPVNVALGPDGNVYVADFENHRIRVVEPDGDTTTLVQQTGFERPFGLAFAADGTLYVQTDRNPQGLQSATTGTIWRVDTMTGVATVVVADVGRPRGLLVLPEPDGRIVLSDYLNDVVRLLDPDTGTITDLAGSFGQGGYVDATGTDARFDGPYGVALLLDGRIAVADLFNHRIRAIALDGTVTTLAGTGTAGADNGPVATATFRNPHDVAVGPAGEIYVAEPDNAVVRVISAGMVGTAAGSGVAGWLDSDDRLAAQFYGLEGIDLAPDGETMWVADGSRGEDLPYHRVRVVDLTR